MRLTKLRHPLAFALALLGLGLSSLFPAAAQNVETQPHGAEAKQAELPEATEKKEDDAVEAGSVESTDRTAAVLQALKKEGLRDLGDFEIGKDSQSKLTLHMAITAQAEAIIREKKFDVPDENFDLQDFTEKLVGVWKQSAQYFQEVVPDCKVHELYFVLQDLGDDRKLTNSRTKTHSAVILGDIRRWHKMYRGISSYYAPLASIHEFTHVVNYQLDTHETQYHRELAAIVFEIMNFYRTGGQDASIELYARRMVLPLKGEPKQILSPQFTGYYALRSIAAFFFSKVLDGTYHTTDKPDKAIEKFARLYLSSKETGDAGFDAACREAGFTAEGGSALTLQLIRTQLYAAILAEKNGAG